MTDGGTAAVLERTGNTGLRGHTARLVAGAAPEPAPASAPDAARSPVQAILARVSSKLGAELFSKYFRHQVLMRTSGAAVEIIVPTAIVAELIQRRFGPVLNEAAAAEGFRGVGFRVDPGAFAGAPAVEAIVPASDAPPAEPQARPRPQAASNVANLRYRLDDFVVGESNKLAYSAAVRLTEPDCPRTFSPLFVHGPCGLGKTHLLQGIAVRFAERNPGATVRYTTAEAFTNDYVNAVRTGRVEQFRKIYRGVDLLCIDDVHFLSNKQGTQSELLHTFDAIGLDGARVVLASDEHPRQIARLNDALVSRFMSGMVVRLDVPDRALREAIIRRIALRRGLALEEPVVALLASSSGAAGATPSVRDLEGALTRIEAVRSLLPDLCTEGGGVGLILARRALGLAGAESPDATGPRRPRKPVRVDLIADEVCRSLRVEISDLMGRGRHKRVVLARSLTAYLSRSLTTLSFPEIARAMGRPNHSTIVTAVKRVQDQIERHESADPAGELGPELAGLTLAQLIDRLRDDILRAAPAA